MNKRNNPYKIEMVSDYGKTYYQVVRKRDEAILYANSSIDNIASFILDEGIDKTTKCRAAYYTTNPELFNQPPVQQMALDFGM